MSRNKCERSATLQLSIDYRKIAKKMRNVHITSVVFCCTRNRWIVVEKVIRRILSGTIRLGLVLPSDKSLTGSLYER